jgi:hypothetical protein
VCCPDGIYEIKVSIERYMDLDLVEALSRVGVDTPLAVAEGGERREEETGMENGKANASNADHPVTISKARLAGPGTI